MLAQCKHLSALSFQNSKNIGTQNTACTFFQSVSLEKRVTPREVLQGRSRHSRTTGATRLIHIEHNGALH